jgi:dCTP deaminase
MKVDSMFINGRSLLEAAPILGMYTKKMKFKGTSYGLSEAGYDIRIQQNVLFINDAFGARTVVREPEGEEVIHNGHFVLASSVEIFETPTNLVGTVKDKSSWARKGLSVFNTVIEPGWNGFLTLELVYNGYEEMEIYSGQGIAQVLYGSLSDVGDYGLGKYQNQEAKPVSSRD